MELNIPDLLDCVQEESVPIHPCVGASADRIKELTMKKVHKYERPRKRGLSFVTKVLVAAVIIASLAIPVMAATGFRLTDWLEGLNKSDYAEWKEHYESWENTEGFWQIGMTARDLTREGMTLAVREVQDSPVTGSLTIHDGYWLEHWNGEAFEKMTAASEAKAGENREIRDGDKFEVEVNWASAYGALESGRYRLVKEFTYTYSDGKTAKLTDWAEFRIFNEDMTPYIEQCNEAMDYLLEKDSYHITQEYFGYEYQNYRPVGGPIDVYGLEVWKSGADSLANRYFTDKKEGRQGAWGELLRDGLAIDIRAWKNHDPKAGVEAWKFDHLLSEEHNSVDYWYCGAALNVSQVGEIWVDEGIISIISTSYETQDVPHHSEQVFRFDADGKLTSVEQYWLPELNCPEEDRVMTGRVIVHDTSDDEIAQVIASQNAGEPYSFSWEQEREEQLEKAAAVKTSGFANTTPVTIENGYDAFMHGFGDYEVVADTHHDARVSYDAGADMWKVEYMWAGGNVHAAIYMNGQGITQLVVMEDYE